MIDKIFLFSLLFTVYGSLFSKEPWSLLALPSKANEEPHGQNAATNTMYGGFSCTKSSMLFVSVLFTLNVVWSRQGSIWRLGDVEKEEIKKAQFMAKLSSCIATDNPDVLFNYMASIGMQDEWEYKGNSVLQLAINSQKWNIVKALLTKRLNLAAHSLADLIYSHEESIIATLVQLGMMPTVAQAIKSQNWYLVDAVISINVNPWLQDDFSVEDLMEFPYLGTIEKILSLPAPNGNVERKYSCFSCREYPNISLALKMFLTVLQDRFGKEDQRRFELVCKYGPIPHDLNAPMMALFPIDLLDIYYLKGINLLSKYKGSNMVSYIVQSRLDSEQVRKMDYVLSKYQSADLVDYDEIFWMILKLDESLPQTWSAFHDTFIDDVKHKVDLLLVLFRYYKPSNFNQHFRSLAKNQNACNFFVLLKLFNIWKAKDNFHLFEHFVVPFEKYFKKGASSLLKKCVKSCELNDDFGMTKLIAATREAYDLEE